MTSRVRFLLVAAVCQGLLGLATVATDASRRPETPLPSTDADRETVLALDDGDEEPLPDADPAVGNLAPFPSSPSTTARGNGARGALATTTTVPSSGTTSTTTKASVPPATTTTSQNSGPKCPNAKTCDIYKVIDTSEGGPHGGTKGWRPDADGLVRIRFYINPTPPAGSGLTADTMEAAHLAGTMILEAQNPRIRFEYQGRSTRMPNQLDGFTVFQFGDGTWHRFDNQGYIVEADIGPKAGTPAGDWAYTPCEQHDGACSPTGGKSEIMSMLMHELWHVMGLADLYGPETAELTLNGTTSAKGDRHLVTPGLGDVLGLRALYPTSAPMPPIYAP